MVSSVRNKALDASLCDYNFALPRWAWHVHSVVLLWVGHWRPLRASSAATTPWLPGVQPVQSHAEESATISFPVPHGFGFTGLWLPSQNTLLRWVLWPHGLLQLTNTSGSSSSLGRHLPTAEFPTVSSSGGAHILLFGCEASVAPSGASSSLVQCCVLLRIWTFKKNHIKIINPYVNMYSNFWFLILFKFWWCFVGLIFIFLCVLH